MENSAFVAEEEALLNRIKSGDDLVSLRDIIDDYIFYRKKDFDDIIEEDPLGENFKEFYSFRENQDTNQVIETNEESVEDKLSNLLGLTNYDEPVNVEELFTNYNQTNENIDSFDVSTISETYDLDVDDVNDVNLFNDLPTNNQTLDTAIINEPIQIENIEEVITADPEITKKIELQNNSETIKENDFNLDALFDLEDLFNARLKEISEYKVPHKETPLEKKLESIKVPKEYRSKINEMLDNAFNMCFSLKKDLNKEKEVSKSINADFEDKRNNYLKSKFDILNDNQNILDILKI